MTDEELKPLAEEWGRLIDENEEAFMSELTALTKKYRLKIWGCGCCGSPDLSKIESEHHEQGHYIYTDKLAYVEPGDSDWPAGMAKEVS